MTYTTITCFYEHTIHTTITNDPNSVTTWINETEYNSYHSRQRLIIGLDTEWRPSLQRGVENPVAILQLCAGLRCLIFQIIHAPYIPQSLVNFFNNHSHMFSGYGINSDFAKLNRHYMLHLVPNMVDLGVLATQVYGQPMTTIGLKGLANAVLGKELLKPMNVRMSCWDNEVLTKEQTDYASIDAFLSFEIARVLISMGGRVDLI